MNTVIYVWQFWDKRIRTFVCSYQKREPYRLAISHPGIKSDQTVIYHCTLIRKEVTVLSYVTFLFEDNASNTK